MKIYSELKELGFFEWLDGEHNLVDTDIKPEYLDELSLTDIHITVVNSMAFRWFREKYKLMFQIFYLRNGNHAALIHKTTPEYMDMIDQIRPSGCVEEVVDCYSYEEAELECLRKLIEIVKNG